MSDPTFGISITRIDNEPRPAVWSDMSVVGLIGTAPAASADVFPLDTPVFMYSDDAAKRTALGSQGTIPDALNLINAQLGEFQVAAKVVVVRVEEGDTTAETIANIVGDGISTGLEAFVQAGPLLGVIPRLLCAPGFTSQRHGQRCQCGVRGLARHLQQASRPRRRGRTRHHRAGGHRLARDDLLQPAHSGRPGRARHGGQRGRRHAAVARRHRHRRQARPREAGQALPLLGQPAGAGDRRAVAPHRLLAHRRRHRRPAASVAQCRRAAPRRTRRRDGDRERRLRVRRHRQCRRGRSLALLQRHARTGLHPPDVPAHPQVLSRAASI